MKEGETPQAIAQKYGISVQQLLGMNTLTNENEIKPGKSLIVPIPINGANTPVPAPPGQAMKDSVDKRMKEVPKINLPQFGNPSVAPVIPRAATNQGAAPVPAPAIEQGKTGAQKSEGGFTVTMMGDKPKEVVVSSSDMFPKDITDKQKALGDATSSSIKGRKERNDKDLPPNEKGLPEDELIQVFKDVVKDGDWQEVSSSKREFIQLSRYFVNHFSCPDGQFEQVLMPQDKFIETEISGNKKDFFLRVGNNPNKQFPLDLALICNGQTFMLNAVVHAGAPSQQIKLKLPNSVKQQKKNLGEFTSYIEKATALPLEDKILRIVKRVYQEQPLSYWEEDISLVSKHRWNAHPYRILVNNVIKTNIEGFIAWDFFVEGIRNGDDTSLLDKLGKVVRGTPVAIGKVIGTTTGRVIVITQDRSDNAVSSSIGGVK